MCPKLLSFVFFRVFSAVIIFFEQTIRPKQKG
jgi:hypothetical protein